MPFLRGRNKLIRLLPLPLLFFFGCSNKAEEPLDPTCTTDAQFFEQKAAPLLESRCYGCHNEEGLAHETRYVLDPFDSSSSLETNYARLQDLIAQTTETPTLFLDKPSGQESHGGGTLVDPLDAEYAVLHELLARLQDPGNCEHPGDAPMTCEPGVIHGGASPYRRLTAQQYQNTVHDLLGVRVPEAYLPATESGHEFRTWNSSNPVSTATAESLLLAAEWVTETLDWDTFLACQSEETETECSQRAIADFAQRAFRRPLTDGVQLGVELRGYRPLAA